jgi:hypothetical protein
MEIVRYDRAGKWYFEPLDSSLRRQKITVHEAAATAVWARDHYNEGAHIFPSLHGGTTFDRLVTSVSTERDMSGYEDRGE